MPYVFNCTRSVPSFGSMAPMTLWLYEPPASKAEAQLRSRVNVKILRDMEQSVKAILGEGRRLDGQIRTSRFIVELVGSFVSEARRYLPPGAWVDLSTDCCGMDVFELLAYLRGSTYRWAVEIIAEQQGDDQASLEDGQPSRLDGWVQERSPLNVPFDSQRAWPETPPGSCFVWYRNGVGTIIGQVVRWKCRSGEEITIYKTLWRPRKGVHCHWYELFPAKPLMLFNLDQLRQSPDKEVIFVADEFLAKEWGEQYPSFIFSAIPGGLQHLPDADLAWLAGRKVRVVMDDAVLTLGRLVERKLQEAGTAKATFGVSLNDCSHPFGDLEAIATGCGVTLLPPPTEVASLEAPEPMDFGTLLEFELPKRKFILGPILQQQGLAMIHAPRGIGKTHVALGIALAVATGGMFLRWIAPEPRRVLYLDGEMPASAMQSRIKGMTAGMGTEPAEGFFRILNPDLIGGIMPDISTEEGQSAIELYLSGVELLILDNLSTLCRSGRENESESWGPVQGWLLELRRRGIAVLIVHHSGKNGAQRGTSRREDVLDTVLKLRRPDDYSASQGARFEIHVEKGRSLFGKDAEPFEAQLVEQDGVAIWTVKEGDPLVECAIDMLRAGKSLRAIEDELGIPKSTVGRLRQNLADDGTLNE